MVLQFIHIGSHLVNVDKVNYLKTSGGHGSGYYEFDVYFQDGTTINIEVEDYDEYIDVISKLTRDE